MTATPPVRCGECFNLADYCTCLGAAVDEATSPAREEQPEPEPELVTPVHPLTVTITPGESFRMLVEFSPCEHEAGAFHSTWYPFLDAQKVDQFDEPQE